MRCDFLIPLKPGVRSFVDRRVCRISCVVMGPNSRVNLEGDALRECEVRCVLFNRVSSTTWL